MVLLRIRIDRIVGGFYLDGERSKADRIMKAWLAWYYRVTS